MQPIFAAKPAVTGMVHVRALPGTPRAAHAIAEICDVAVREARLYAEHGLHGIVIENMHDVPYLNGAVGPEIVAGMTAVGAAVRAAVDLPLGVQILAAANHEALAVAHAVGAAFVRVENFVFAHVADEGLMPNAAAGELLRYRRRIGADGVRIVADIKKKHASHSVTADVSLAETARAAAFCGADGVIVTGSATGSAAAVADVRAVADANAGAVFVGSGVTAENVGEFVPHVDGVLVGSAFKYDGLWSNEVEPVRVAGFMAAYERSVG